MYHPKIKLILKSVGIQNFEMIFDILPCQSILNLAYLV